MNNISILHDSREVFFRDPFGAVPCGQQVTIRLKIEPNVPLKSVRLRTWKEQAVEEVFQMEEIGQGMDYRTFQVLINVPLYPGLLWYYFIIEAMYKTYYYGKKPGHSSSAGQLYEYPPDSYQITVYKNGFETPCWFKDCIMYQIFVDRFCNGNEDGSILNVKDNCIVHRDWNEKPNYMPDPETGKYLNNDFFGGNLQGIIKKLPYLKELGIDVIYLNPVFESNSNHKYNTGDYMKIDSMFGDNKIFEILRQKAGERGISIILDGVFSHTGCDSIYFNKDGNYRSIGAYQSKESPYYPWYTFVEFPDKYECWWGIDTLPNVNEIEPSYQDFILNNENSVVKYWMGLGSRGWRLDVADELPGEFLKNFRKTVKDINPDAVIIGEVWEDASNKTSYGEMRKYLLGEELDSVTNYPLRSALLGFLLYEWDAERLHNTIMSLYENYPKHCFYSMMNFLGNHDTARIRTILGGALFDGSLSGELEDRYKLSKDQEALADKRVRLASLFQMTFPGVPCIYYGDESGLQGFKDPFSRCTYPWGREDKELIEWYKKIICLRRKYDALRTGEFIPVYCANDVYGFIRMIKNGEDVFGEKRNNNFILVLFNRSEEESIVSIDLGGWNIKRLSDALNHDAAVNLSSNSLFLKIAPLEAKVLVQQDAPH